MICIVLAAEIRGALGGPVQASRCGNVDTESHAALRSLTRVLKEKEMRHHGEYRTRRLVLAAWDRMETSGQFTQLGL